MVKIAQMGTRLRGSSLLVGAGAGEGHFDLVYSLAAVGTVEALGEMHITGSLFDKQFTLISWR